MCFPPGVNYQSRSVSVIDKVTDPAVYKEVCRLCFPTTSYFFKFLLHLFVDRERAV